MTKQEQEDSLVKAQEKMKNFVENDYIRKSHLLSYFPFKTMVTLNKLINEDENFPQPKTVLKSKFYKRSEIQKYIQEKF